MSVGIKQAIGYFTVKNGNGFFHRFTMGAIRKGGELTPHSVNEIRRYTFFFRKARRVNNDKKTMVSTV